MKENWDSLDYLTWLPVAGNHIDEQADPFKGQPILVGQALDGFKYSTFPYDFSMAAYLDLGKERIMYSFRWLV